MGAVMMAVLTKAGVALAEAIIARMVWKLCVALAGPQRAYAATA